MKECYKIKELFGAYVYNNVTPDERNAVEKHIDSCKGCADDLRSRQEILKKFKPPPSQRPDEIPQRIQGDFALNVYRRIASETLRKRSRHVFLWRFVFQPSLVTIILAIAITIGFVRINSGPDTINKPSPVAARSDETDKKELRAALYEKEFFRRQETPQRSGQVYAATSEMPTTESFPPDTDRFRDTLPDSRLRLEEANFIYYSLREPRRALAEYQWVVDYYPGTEDAKEAQRKIKTILGSEYSIQSEDVVVELTTDMGI